MAQKGRTGAIHPHRLTPQQTSATFGFRSHLRKLQVLHLPGTKKDTCRLSHVT